MSSKHRKYLSHKPNPIHLSHQVPAEEMRNTSLIFLTAEHSYHDVFKLPAQIYLLSQFPVFNMICPDPIPPLEWELILVQLLVQNFGLAKSWKGQTLQISIFTCPYGTELILVQLKALTGQSPKLWFG